MATYVELKSDWSLLNPNFEGYKLSLDKQPLYKTDLKHGIDSVVLNEEQFSYHHAKVLGVFNHLIQDPWDPTAVYFVDKQWNIVHTVAHDTSVEASRCVYTIPDADSLQQVKGRCNASIHLVSEEMAVVSSGTGQVHIVETGPRSDGKASTWKNLLSKAVLEDNQPCLLVDAVIYGAGDKHKIDCLLAHVVDATPEQKDKYSSQHLTMLEWTTFSSADKKTWSLDRTRQLLSRRPFHYVALGRQGESITVAGEADFIFTHDSELPVVSDEEKEVEKTESRPEYTWYQTAADISVQFTIPEPIEKKDIYMNMKHDHIDFGVKNKAELLKGTLCGQVDTDTCTWTIEGRRIELVLDKKVERQWPLVVEGNTRGEMLTDQTEVAAIHERLEYLTSAEWNPSPDKDSKPYNTQELEECDMFPDDNSVILHLHGDTHKVTHKVSLGSHQWLFSANGQHNSAPMICLRHDVDGLVWKQSNGQSGEPSPSPVWTHTATFNAFGYVQASKQQRRYSTCSPDFSYALICDNARHVYLYRTSSPVMTPVRNRKTGQTVSAVAKQQVITLETMDTILGIVAANDMCFIATQNNMYMIKV